MLISRWGLLFEKRSLHSNDTDLSKPLVLSLNLICLASWMCPCSLTYWIMIRNTVIIRICFIRPPAAAVTVEAVRTYLKLCSCFIMSALLISSHARASLVSRSQTKPPLTIIPLSSSKSSYIFQYPLTYLYLANNQHKRWPTRDLHTFYFLLCSSQVACMLSGSLMALPARLSAQMKPLEMQLSPTAPIRRVRSCYAMTRKFWPLTIELFDGGCALNAWIEAITFHRKQPHQEIMICTGSCVSHNSSCLNRHQPQGLPERAYRHANSTSCPYIVNLRFAINHCVFGNLSANATESAPFKCREICEPIHFPIKTGLVITNFSTLYEYCAYENGTTTGVARRTCIDCLRKPSSDLKIESEIIGNCTTPTFYDGSSSAYWADLLLFPFSPDLATLGHACRNDPRLEPGIALNMSISYSYFYDDETVQKRRLTGKLIAGMAALGVIVLPVAFVILIYIVQRMSLRRKKQRQSSVLASFHHDVEDTTTSEATTVVDSSSSRPQSMATVLCDALKPNVKNERKVLHKVVKGVK